MRRRDKSDYHANFLDYHKNVSFFEVVSFSKNNWKKLLE